MFHGIPPVFDAHCHTLILGSFPSVKTRQTGFFYGHPQNRFWKVLAALYGRALPKSVAEKKALLLDNGLALWDVVACCDIAGSADSTIANAVPNDIAGLVAKTAVDRVFTNGATAHRLYQQHCAQPVGIADTQLPSTSPANAAYSLDSLVACWCVILQM